MNKYTATAFFVGSSIVAVSTIHSFHSRKKPYGVALTVAYTASSILSFISNPLIGLLNIPHIYVIARSIDYLLKIYGGLLLNKKPNKTLIQKVLPPITAIGTQCVADKLTDLVDFTLLNCISHVVTYFWLEEIIV